MSYIFYYNIYISYLYLDEFNIKQSNSMSPLDYQQKIDMGLMSENQFGPLGDNGNPNRLRPKMVMVPNTPNQETVSPLPI